MFEKSERPGGMLTYGIPSFKLEKDVIEAEVEVIRLMGAEFRYGVEVGRDVTLDELRAQGFKAFYVAIGCQGGRLAGIPGEDAEDVTVAVDFLREVNSGKIDALPAALSWWAAATWPSTWPATPAAWAPSTLRCSAWRVRRRCPPARRSVARPSRTARTSAAAGAPRRSSGRGRSRMWHHL